MKSCAKILFLLVVVNGSFVLAEPRYVYLLYLDGSANRYRIISTPVPMIEYEPMTPMESSSGFYSGGTPKKKNITMAQLTRIVDIFEQAFRAARYHIPNRIKGSGLVVITSDGTRRVCILAPNSHMQIYLEKELSAILSD